MDAIDWPNSLYIPAPPIPHDAQTVPAPPHPVHPPRALFYGWRLTPELFGGEDEKMTIICADDSEFKHKRPTTSPQAAYVFHLVTDAMGLDGIEVEFLGQENVFIAKLAEVDKSDRVRSVLDQANKIPPAAILEKFEKMLKLTKKPEWIETLPWIMSEEWKRELAAPPPLEWKRTSDMEAQRNYGTAMPRPISS